MLWKGGEAFKGSDLLLPRICPPLVSTELGLFSRYRFGSIRWGKLTSQSSFGKEMPLQ